MYSMFPELLIMILGAPTKQKDEIQFSANSSVAIDSSQSSP